jgi:dTDP-4-dehydrorhamnose 3,5-epimerase-like enzyme
MTVNQFDFKTRGDARGNLVAIEGGADVPFEIKRVYYIWGTDFSTSRGLHAHRKLEQALVCLHGSVKIVLDDGKERKEVRLENPARGLYVGRRTWREMKEFSEDAVLLVLASEHYEESDYIRDYDKFLDLVSKGWRE